MPYFTLATVLHYLYSHITPWPLSYSLITKSHFILAIVLPSYHIDTLHPSQVLHSYQTDTLHPCQSYPLII